MTVFINFQAATSSLTEMTNGTYFKPVLSDPSNPSKVDKVIFCSGKYYYEMHKHRMKQKKENTAIIRLEVDFAIV